MGLLQWLPSPSTVGATGSGAASRGAIFGNFLAPSLHVDDGGTVNVPRPLVVARRAGVHRIETKTATVTKKHFDSAAHIRKWRWSSSYSSSSGSKSKRISNRRDSGVIGSMISAGSGGEYSLSFCLFLAEVSLEAIHVFGGIVHTAPSI